VLKAISGLGVPFVARGLVVRNGWMVMFGLAVESAGKIWFIYRMALLYDGVAPARCPGTAPGHTAGAPPPGAGWRTANWIGPVCDATPVAISRVLETKVVGSSIPLASAFESAAKLAPLRLT